MRRNNRSDYDQPNNIQSEGGRMLLGLITTLGIAAAFAAATASSLETVQHVDLKRYMGLWHEIARYANRFQRDCASDTTAKYTLLENGKVEVLNSCRKKNGSFKEAKGKAKVVDSSNAKLKVTFFWPFHGDYWIIGLDPDYRWAVVGEPSRKYLWILSRSPHMEQPEYQKALQQIRAAGYDESKLIPTKQSAP